ncbi:MAG TPA: acyl-ACP--UDP-N-acetylglucosamine O-acyltransferase [Phycisphaerae bacterium]|nr:acyl-ACP--UDP-N-acetylglucosamine O-acyltransferase [Phycisphaerae bacterium]
MAELKVLREIDPSARVAPDASVGPYCVVGPNVTIGPRTRLVGRVSVSGHTTIGSDNVFEAGCVLGAVPQDLKYAGGPTLLHIGHRNRFGRFVTAHIGTESGGYLTRIGDDNVFMDGSHIAHDCYVDDHVCFGRNVMLAGHIRVHTGAVIEELSGVHHFVTIGRYSRVGARTPVRRDVPPFTEFLSAESDSTPAVRGIYEAGISRAALPSEEEKDLRRALHELFDNEFALQTRIEQLFNLGVEGEVAELCKFCQQSLRGVYGRYRELFRGRIPPEARQYLPREQWAQIAREMP